MPYRPALLSPILVAAAAALGLATTPDPIGGVAALAIVGSAGILGWAIATLAGPRRRVAANDNDPLPSSEPLWRPVDDPAAVGL